MKSTHAKELTPMSEKHGIKETMELLESVSALVDGVSEVLKDGKVSLTDVMILPGLIMAMKPGIEGVASIKEEVSDLSPEEMKQVISALVDVVVKVANKIK